MEVDILIFACEDQFFGVPAAMVQEVLPAVAVARLPAGQPPILGVMNLRGRMLPVLSARTLLGWDAAAPPREMPTHPSDHFLVVQDDGLSCALHVQRAIELIRARSGGDVQAGAGDQLGSNDQRDGSEPTNRRKIGGELDWFVQTQHGLVQVIQPARLLSSEQAQQVASIASANHAAEQTL